MITVDRSEAKRTAAAAFEAHGISTADAAHTAQVLVSADAEGKHSHGLLRLSRFLQGVKHGNVAPDGDIRITRDHGATAQLSGGSRLGPVVATEAMAEACVRADEYGIGCVGVVDSNHLGMLGYYTDAARQDGYVALGLTNTEPAMPPYGSAEPVLGTNPIAVGLPTDPPFNLDMSTAAIARGRVKRAAERGESLPDGVALDTDGEPTTDPEAALEGTIRPFGGPKGSGLAVAVEVLAGGLVGADMGAAVTGTYHTKDPCTKGDLFVALDPAAIGGEHAVSRIERFLSQLVHSEPAPGFETVRLPGARDVAADDAEQINVDAAVWTEVQRFATGE